MPWVVYDARASDAAILGLAVDLEAAIRVVDDHVPDFDRRTLVIELPFSDAGSIKARVRGDEREWPIEKKSVRC